MAVRTLSPARVLDPSWLLGMGDGTVIPDVHRVFVLRDRSSRLVLPQEEIVRIRSRSTVVCRED